MTPELKVACEVIFQEHKVSGQPIKWNRDAFRGRISIGLSEMAKETLVKKNIIVRPDKSKKIFTQLNPVVATATSFEEAEKIVVNKIPALAGDLPYDPEVYIADHVFGFGSPSASAAQYHALSVDTDTAEITIAKTKWYMKPLFFYVVWPIVAAAAGALITRLISLAQAELFFNLK